ncbi:MAG TPA: hypothetical protein VK335_11245 [Bryobacteraceae bacterium]|nr:hypothetical protein [Bryobacteraceae bacterium]
MKKLVLLLLPFVGSACADSISLDTTFDSSSGVYTYSYTVDADHGHLIDSLLLGLPNASSLTIGGEYYGPLTVDMPPGYFIVPASLGEAGVTPDLLAWDFDGIENTEGVNPLDISFTTHYAPIMSTYAFVDVSQIQPSLGITFRLSFLVRSMCRTMTAPFGKH